MEQLERLAKIHYRIHVMQQTCDNCPLDGKNNGHGVGCEVLPYRNFQDYEKICLEWDKEHPEEVRE